MEQLSFTDEQIGIIRQYIKIQKKLEDDTREWTKEDDIELQVYEGAVARIVGRLVDQLPW